MRPFLPSIPLLVSLLSACQSGPYSDSSRVARSAMPLVVAEHGQCHIELTRFSYDDPGTDDAEFIELRAVGAFTTHPGGSSSSEHSSQDAAPVSACGEDGSVPAMPSEAGPASAPTLGDCGLVALELLNGGSECSVYRDIPLADVEIPADGFVVLCSEDATVASPCDVTHAGTRKLPNGWLQNGPNDGLRFVGANASEASIAYEPSLDTCFGTEAVVANTETGETDDPGGSDDVNVACAEGFALLPAGETTLRTEPHCEKVPPADGGTSGEAELDGKDLNFEASVPPGQPEPRGTASQSIRVDEAPPALLPPDTDAGFDGGVLSGRAFPNVPGGCGVSRRGAPVDSNGTVWILALAGLGLRPRRRAPQRSPAPPRLRPPESRRLALRFPGGQREPSVPARSGRAPLR